MAVVLAGLAWTVFKPTVVPNVTMTAAGESTTVDQVRGQKLKLVLALIHPTDPNSKTAVTMLKTQFATYEGRATFAGLMLADAAAAEAFEKDQDLPFTVYAMTPQQNPAEYNEPVKAVGGFRNRFFVGTVLVLDQSRRISVQVNGNELENLSSALSKL